MTDNNQSTAAANAVKSPPGIVSRIRTYFLTGLIVAGPVAITLWLIWWFVTWVDGLVRPFIPALTGRRLICRWKFPGSA